MDFQKTSGNFNIHSFIKSIHVILIIAKINRFHVDDLPSPHAYVRLEKGKTIKDIPEEVIEDCCQIVKEGSIQGSKLKSVPVVYTYWSNLKKTQGMDVGQVSFHDEKAVLKRTVTKDKEIIKYLNKTKVQKEVDLKKEREDYDKNRQRELKKEKELQRIREEKERQEKKKQKELLHYVGFFDEGQMTSNKDITEDDFDFM